MSEPQLLNSIKIQLAGTNHTEEIDCVLLEVDGQPYCGRDDINAQFESLSRVLVAQDARINALTEHFNALISGQAQRPEPSAVGIV